MTYPHRCADCGDDGFVTVNGIVLCQSCHKKFRAQKITDIEEYLERSRK